MNALEERAEILLVTLSLPYAPEPIPIRGDPPVH